jgi:hypothetical protein
VVLVEVRELRRTHRRINPIHHDPLSVNHTPIAQPRRELTEPHGTRDIIQIHRVEHDRDIANLKHLVDLTITVLIDQLQRNITTTFTFDQHLHLNRTQIHVRITVITITLHNNITIFISIFVQTHITTDITNITIHWNTYDLDDNKTFTYPLDNTKLTNTNFENHATTN